MGTSVCTYHIRDCTQADCLRALALVKSPTGYLSTYSNHWLSVVDEDAEAFRLEELEGTIVAISKLLHADLVLTGVYDDDASLYAAFHAGIVVDRFFSGAKGFEWLGKRRIIGDPERVAGAYEWWQGADRLESALKKKYRMESSRLEEIVRAFGIPEHRAFTTIRDIVSPLLPQFVAQLPPDSDLAMRCRDRQSYTRFEGHME